MNQLHNLQAFHQALTNYQLSSEALQTLTNTPLVALVGPTGGGRNTIIDELLKTGKYYFTVSDTTRQPRVNNGLLEISGREYWFRTEDDMLADIQAGKFLEAEIIHEQQVSGTSIRELEKAHADSKIAITDADIGGVSNILKLKPAATVVLVVPPSFQEWQRRLTSRGAMPVDELKRRLQTAVVIFKVGVEDDRLNLIVNDNYVTAAERLDKLASGEPISEEDKAVAKKLCQQLADETQAYHSTL